MGTLSELKARIANELSRSDLTDEIALAIQSSIDYYSVETMWFQEDRAEDVTVIDQEYYALPSDYITVNSLRCTINDNNDYLLEPRSNDYFERAYQSSTIYTGYPQDYTIYDQQIRLGPIPNGVFTLTIHYVKFLEDMALDSQSNNYTARLAEQLIRARAKVDLSVNKTKDYEEAAAQKAQEREIYRQLRKKHTLYISSPGIQRYL